MIQGDQGKCPADYVRVQEVINARHTNGMVEFEERAIDYVDMLRKFWATNGIKPTSILDVGCRTGYALAHLLQYHQAMDIEGVDLVPSFVELAATRFDAKVADVHALPYADNSFDWVMCTQVIEHAYDVKLALSELFRVADRGLMLSLPLEDVDKYEANASHLAYSPSAMDWVRLLDVDGWELVYLETGKTDAKFGSHPFHELNTISISKELYSEGRSYCANVSRVHGSKTNGGC